MWTVYEKKNVSKIIKKAPKEVLKNYEIWKRIVEIEGPQGLRLIKGFHDETLRGTWHGYRSSRLNRQWRVIYTIEARELQVYVVEINPHEY
jgi:proteic killer suppression protein